MRSKHVLTETMHRGGRRLNCGCPRPVRTHAHRVLTIGVKSVLRLQVGGSVRVVVSNRLYTGTVPGSYISRCATTCLI